jgi:phenylacetate-coenzyme A ligase PaaK-like adenylate-forming protein
MAERTRGDARPSGDAWARVRRELSEVAGQTSAQAQRWQLGRARALLRHHARQRRNVAYRELLEDAGLDAMSAMSAWDQIPVIDKQWLADAGYHRQPACDGPVLIVATSGSTATQVLVPVTAECANRGLGDNFLRTLAMSGAGSGQRHWGIEHQPAGQGQGHTGSEVSMTWLARHCGDHALVTAATEPLAEQLRRAAAFGPDTISGSPGFLRQIAQSAQAAALRPVLLVYGGAMLSDTDAALLRASFPRARLTAFYPTTDAGALGAAPAGDGVYRTFTETHLIEVLDGDGRPVPAGARGDVVVTQFDAWAAPVIRYRVGDRATYRGWAHGRLLLSDIERAAEAAIGSTLVPYSDLRTWTPRLAARDPSVLAVQLVRGYSPGQQREQPIVRVIGRADGAELTAAARSLLDDFPQIVAEIASGELAPARVEFRDPPATLAGHWKIPLYVDERTPCPSE